MSVVDRKLCSNCGEPNLSTDLCCWACGGSHFAPLNARLAGERTVYLAEALETTQEWERDRPRWMPLVYLGSAAVFALFMCIVGFWIGRSSSPAEPSVAQAPVAPAQPIALPTPPTHLSAAPATGFSVPHPVPAAVIPSDPRVSVRTVPPRTAARTAVPQKPRIAAPPTTVVYSTPPAQVSAPTRVTTIYTYTTNTAPLPSAQPRIPAATGKTSVVSLRNDTSATVEVSFEGTDARTARVSGGSTLPLVLTPGSYQVRVSGSNAAPGRTSAVLAEGKSYSLRVNGQKDDGGTRLVIVEPGIDGG